MTRASAVLLVLLAGCATARPVVLEPLAAVDQRATVVLVPGITGSRLAEAEHGRVVWGRARHLFLPRDGGRAAALSLVEPDAGRLAPAGAVSALRPFGLLRYEFYAPLERLMAANGYRQGDLDAPDPRATFYVFDHDWRLGTPEIAARLAEALERLRQARGSEELRVHLVCHSNAGQIARWLAKHGAGSLEQAERGVARPPPGLRVESVIFVGTAHGGALATLDDLLGGRRYVPLVGRRFLPEVLFTFPPLWESLPYDERCPVIDASGACLDVALAEPADWARLGWSIHDRVVARRADRWPRLFGNRETREAALAERLSFGRRFARVLERDSNAFGTARYYSIQSLALPTPRRVVVLPGRRSGRRTVVGDRGPVRRDPWLRARALDPGDGHATLGSLESLSPQERRALARPTAWVRARHRDIIRHPAVHRFILEFLLDAERGTAERGTGTVSSGQGSGVPKMVPVPRSPVGRGTLSPSRVARRARGRT